MNDSARRYRMLIDGEMCEAEAGDWITSVNPATEEVLGLVPRARSEDVGRAVTAAERASKTWERVPVVERARLVRELARRSAERAGELLDVEVQDTGNTRRRMTKDVTIATDLMEYFAGVALEQKGESIPSTSTGLHFTVRQPYGVVGRILAFNHPFMFAGSRLAAPLIAGNSVVLKPSEESPISTTILAEMCQDLFPPGVVSILTGTGTEAGASLVSDPRVKRLTFIGSVPTGREIQKMAALSAVKNVSLELGGKNPLIAFDDADPEAVANAAVNAMNFGHQGQSCGSTSRLLLHEALYDDVVERVTAKIAALRVGDPQSDQTDMGPLNSVRHLDRVRGHIAAAREDGACLLTGGKRPPGEQFDRGYWLEPTFFGDVTPDMRLFRTEVFGPVLAASKWRTSDELLMMANGVEYGLTASIWTNDIRRALVAAQKIQAGYVWINGTSTHFLGTSFGGVKQSGLGSEEGLEELLSFTEQKTINIVLPDELA